MIKKISICILGILLILSVSVFADEQSDTALDKEITDSNGLNRSQQDVTDSEVEGFGKTPSDDTSKDEGFTREFTQGTNEARPTMPENGNRTENMPELPEGAESMPFRGQGRGPGNMGGMMPQGFGDIPEMNGGASQEMPAGDVTAQEGTESLSDFLNENSAPIASMVLLVFGFIFVIFYKRKIY